MPRVHLRLPIPWKPEQDATIGWVGEEARVAGVPGGMVDKEVELLTAKPGKLREVVLYDFYRKPMANVLPNIKSSAQPEAMKVATVAGEVLRRIKNTSRDLPPEVVEHNLQVYMEELEIILFNSIGNLQSFSRFFWHHEQISLW